jgi:hypothetical protein
MPRRQQYLKQRLRQLVRADIKWRTCSGLANAQHFVELGGHRLLTLNDHLKRSALIQTAPTTVDTETG